MMKRGISMWAMAMAAGAAFAAGSAELKIGVVDMARVMDTFPETKTAEAQLDKQKAEFEKERKDLLEDYRKLRESYEAAVKDADNPAWSDAERKKKTAAAEEKLSAVEDKRQMLRETSDLRQKQLQDQTLRLRQRILEKLRAAVSEYAESNGFTLVLDGAAGTASLPPVIYRKSALDITDEIVKITAPEEARGNSATNKPAIKP
jgi:outer membrane protein